MALLSDSSQKEIAEVLQNEEEFDVFCNSLPLKVAGLSRTGRELRDDFGNFVCHIPRMAMDWTIQDLEQWIVQNLENFCE